MKHMESMLSVIMPKGRARVSRVNVALERRAVVIDTGTTVVHLQLVVSPSQLALRRASIPQRICFESINLKLAFAALSIVPSRLMVRSMGLAVKMSSDWTVCMETGTGHGPIFTVSATLLLMQGIPRHSVLFPSW